MSNLYNLEPQPTAKVILHTTSGDLSLELFAKQTPLASQNFLQHCLDGYYDGTIFHRLVPNFIIQGGDPTGTGSGGVSAINNGAPFENEVHSRLKFNRRGLLGMANEGEKAGNTSQFFLTLGVTPELQGKHTMFGRIEGDTIYNMVKMGDTELVEGEGSERPLYPTKITSTDIVINPFEDMQPRVRAAPRSLDSNGKTQQKKRKKPAGKNVLSFGAEEGDEEETPVSKKTKANPMLFGTLPEEPYKPDTPKQKLPKRERPETIEKKDARQPTKSLSPSQAPPPESHPSNESNSEPDSPPPPQKSTLEQTNAEIAALKASMKRSLAPGPKEPAKPKSVLQDMIPPTSIRGRKRHGKTVDEKGALDMFKAFKTRLENIPAPVASGNQSESKHEGNNPENKERPLAGKGTPPDPADDDEQVCDLHFIVNCQSCKAWDQDGDGAHHGSLEKEDDEDDDGTWMAHQLTFAKDTLGKDLEWKKKMEEIEVIDPREKARAIQQKQREEKEARKKR